MIKHSTATRRRQSSLCEKFFRSLFTLLLAWPLSAYAQEIAVQGTVTDNVGSPLVGVSILIVGTGSGTITDSNGQYKLDIQKGASIEFNYLGFQKDQLTIDKPGTYDIQLTEDLTTLNEIVVTGYGTIQRSDFTGSSSMVKLDNTSENRNLNVTEALQGRVAGVQIRTNTGQPGSGITFNIHGITSVTGSSQPLIVIDGQPIESNFSAASAGMNLDGGNESSPADPLASINPADIESVEILKDASSVAIYGSRGANGVVLITTRSGKNGKDKLSYSNRFDVNELPRKLGVLNTADYLSFTNEALVNDGSAPLYTQPQVDSIIAISPNVDWQEEIYTTMLSQDHQLSFSGNNERTNYYLTANYADQKGILKNSDYVRYALRANFSREFSKKLTIGLRTYFSLADRNYGQESNWTGILGSSAVMGALAFNPLQSGLSSDGNIDEEFVNNPLLIVTRVKDKTQIRTLTSNINLNYKIVDGLSYTLRAGVNDLYSLRQIYNPRGTFIGNSAPGGSATRADNSNFNALVEHLLQYERIIADKHSMNAVVGYSYQKWTNRASSTSGVNFPSDALGYNSLQAAASPGRTYTSISSRALQSVLGRVNYSFDKRYLLTLTARYDGASRLAPGNKWNLFPSIGAGWNISQEKFFSENIDFINELKIRGSYGVAGNENVPIGATQAKYSINHVVMGSSIIPGYVTGDFENPNLKWETTYQWNLGADVAFFGDRLLLSVDLYKKNTKDLLINLSLPASSTYSDYYTNIGEVMNKGIDIESTYRSSIGKVTWDVGANFSVFDNEVINMGSAEIVYGRSYLVGGQVLLNQPVHVAKSGYPISSFWGYKTAGIYQNVEEIAAGPETTTAKPGDVKWVDTDNNGKITDADKTIIGNPSADFTYGFNSKISYKRLTFSFAFFGSQGNELINLNKWIIGINNSTGSYNQFRETYDGRWTGEGTSNKYPRATANSVRSSQRVPDWLVEDASFLRLQNVNLSYSFSVPRVKSASFKVFLSATNVFTITKYSGYDPNINAFGQLPLNSGVDLGTIPQPRTYSAGVQVDF